MYSQTDAIDDFIHQYFVEFMTVSMWNWTLRIVTSAINELLTITT